nr:hypothetical protein [uncultured Roseateles sp.]
MKFQAQVQVVGMKASKGTLDDGGVYDSTKVYALVDLDATKGNAVGQAAAEYNIGLSGELDKYKHLPFPFVAMADMEIVTNGKTQKTVVHALRPITDQPVAKKAA